MNAVKEWTSVICMAALIASLLHGLVPNGSMERMIRFVIGAFIICAMLQPLGKAIPEIRVKWNTEEENPVNSRLETTVQEQTKSAAQESIKNLVVAELSGIHIKCKNVRVMMDTDADGRISINRVIVELEKGYEADRQRASDHLTKVLGLKMEVTADEGKG